VSPGQRANYLLRIGAERDGKGLGGGFAFVKRIVAHWITETHKQNVYKKQEKKRRIFYKRIKTTFCLDAPMEVLSWGVL